MPQKAAPRDDDFFYVYRDTQLAGRIPILDLWLQLYSVWPTDIIVGMANYYASILLCQCVRACATKTSSERARILCLKRILRKAFTPN
jgi:hypothetical protein